MKTNPNQLHPRRHPGRVAALILILLLLLGASYETISEAVDLHRYPPPGEMVEMGGYALHLRCTGEGSPAVILEAGLGGGVATWPFVQAEVAKATRVCSYDRSGFAWSTGTTPENGYEVVTRLHELLQRAGTKEPYILVGHSLGGLYSQLYAATFPEEVSGLVLVEARHQDFEQRLAATGQKSGSPASSVMTRMISVLNRLGVVRLVARLGVVPGIPEGLPPGMIEMGIRPSSQASAAAEQRIMAKVEDEVRAVHLNLGDKPLVVVTSDPARSPSTDSTIWFETQRLYLSLSSKSHLVKAEGSGHLVPYDNPAVVTEAILEVMEATRY